ncbi:hypothetical protein Pfo_010160 [Paulownia fortunei]|nr:hypothetical protein Pfo_010160 [Paulownia fortunei]
MSCQHVFTSLCNLIFPCMNLFTESLGRSSHDNLESHSSASPGVSELPTSVILEIFLKLPINSIIRCKCVCKSWYKLISDPYFANTYLMNPPFTAIVRSEHRTITNPLDDESFCSLEIGRNALDFPTNGIIGIMGSCNGLLCLVKSPQLENESHGNYVYNRDSIYNNQTVCVINPLLGECMLLPVTSAEDIRDVVYGFGLSASTNECKVLRLVIKYISLCIGYEIKVSGGIFTIGVDNRWRCFEDSSIPYYIFPCGITLNGILHWIGYDRHSGVIFAFDIGEERGHHIPLPLGLGDEPGNIVLAVWDDHLCLSDNSSEIQVDVWIMKQYGVVESWTRDFILKSLIPSDLRPYPLIPITTLRNGDQLMSRPYGQSLISFYPKIKKCSKLDVSDVEGTVSFLFGYIPRFFSPNNVFIRAHPSVVDV